MIASLPSNLGSCELTCDRAHLHDHSRLLDVFGSCPVVCERQYVKHTVRHQSPIVWIALSHTRLCLARSLRSNKINVIEKCSHS